MLARRGPCTNRIAAINTIATSTPSPAELQAKALRILRRNCAFTPRPEYPDGAHGAKHSRRPNRKCASNFEDRQTDNWVCDFSRQSAPSCGPRVVLRAAAWSLKKSPFAPTANFPLWSSARPALGVPCRATTVACAAVAVASRFPSRRPSRRTPTAALLPRLSCASNMAAAGTWRGLLGDA